MRKLFIGITVFAVLSTSIATAQTIPSTGFYQSPTHCLNLAGGSDRSGESVTKEFGQAFADEIAENIRQGKTLDETLKFIRAQCSLALAKK